MRVHAFLLFFGLNAPAVALTLSEAVSSACAHHRAVEQNVFEQARLEHQRDLAQLAYEPTLRWRVTEAYQDATRSVFTRHHQTSLQPEWHWQWENGSEWRVRAQQSVGSTATTEADVTWRQPLRRGRDASLNTLSRWQSEQQLVLQGPRTDALHDRIVLETITDYLAVWISEVDYQQAVDEVKRFDALWHKVDKRVRLGEMAPFDANQIAVQRQERERLLAERAVQVDAAYARLALTMGQSTIDALAPASALALPTLAPLETYVTRWDANGLARREHDAKREDLQRQLAKAKDDARWGIYAEVDARVRGHAETGSLKDAWHQATQNQDGQWGARIVLEQQFGKEAGQRIAGRRLALKQHDAERPWLEREYHQSIRQQWEAARHYRDQLAGLAEQMAIQETLYQQALTKVEQGTLSVLDLQQVHQQWAHSQQQWWKGQWRYWMAWAHLEESVGGLHAQTLPPMA